jgi:hypothetical protein
MYQSRRSFLTQAASMTPLLIFPQLRVGMWQKLECECGSVVTPSGDDDSPLINELLKTTGHAHLQVGTKVNGKRDKRFILHSPIQILRHPKAMLTGDGAVVLEPRPRGSMIEKGTYKTPIEVLWSQGVTLNGFAIDTTNLYLERAMPNYAVRIVGSPDCEARNIEIYGSSYGDYPGWKTGGIRAGGILVANSRNVYITRCRIEDLGYWGMFPGDSVPYAGIESSGSRVHLIRNTIRNVGVGVLLVNREKSDDASKSRILNNIIAGAALIGHPNGVSSRSIKIQGTRAMPIRQVEVSQNYCSNFGGWGGFPGGVGLYLVGACQDGEFHNNWIVGDNSAEFALEIGHEGLVSGNVFSKNTFGSGRNSSTCRDAGGHCADVAFSGSPTTGEIPPDQIGLGRYFIGDNTLLTGSIRR